MYKMSMFDGVRCCSVMFGDARCLMFDDVRLLMFDDDDCCAIHDDSNEGRG